MTDTNELQSERPDEALRHRLNIAADVKRLSILMNWLLDHLNLREQIEDEHEVAWSAASKTRSKYFDLEEKQKQTKLVKDAAVDIESLGR